MELVAIDRTFPSLGMTAGVLLRWARVEQNDLMEDILTLAKRLNWKSDDGIFFWMLNDGLRNDFYRRSLEKVAKDKVVLDIGVGAGLLTVLALKAGAKKVIGYEQNWSRYCYAKAVFRKLGLTEKVEIHHGNFVECPIPSEKIDVIVTETFNGDPFEEGILQSVEHLRRWNLAEDFVMIPDVLELKGRFYEREEIEPQLLLGESANLPRELMDLYNCTLGASTETHRSFCDPRSLNLGHALSAWFSLPTLHFTALIRGNAPVSWSTKLELPANPEARNTFLLSWDMKFTVGQEKLQRSDYRDKSEFFGHWNFAKFDFSVAGNIAKKIEFGVVDRRLKNFT